MKKIERENNDEQWIKIIKNKNRIVEILIEIFSNPFFLKIYEVIDLIEIIFFFSSFKILKEKIFCHRYFRERLIWEGTNQLISSNIYKKFIF